MIKKLHLISIVLITFLSGCNTPIKDQKEQATNDSIKKYIDLAESDTVAFDKRIKYNDKAYAMLDLKKKDTAIRSQLNRICYIYYLFNKNKKLKLIAEQLRSLSLKYNDSISLAKAYRNLGLYYMAISSNEKAIDYFFKAKKIFTAYDKIDKALKVMGDISNTQSYASDFLGSNKTAFEMLTLAKKTNNRTTDFFCYAKIGNNLSFLNNNAESIRYLKKAEKTGSSTSAYFGLYNNLASSFINIKHYNEALKYLNVNLDNKKLLPLNPTSYSIALSLSSYIQLKKNDFTNLEKNLNLAEKYFVLSNSESGRNYNQSYLSMYYEKIRDTVKSIEHAKRAVEISKSYKNPTDVLICLKQLIKVDKKNASVKALEYIRINDSLQIAERNFRDKFARIAFETDEISQEKEKAIHQKKLITSIATAIIVIIILILIITWQRSKQKQLQLLQEQQTTNEEIYQLMLGQKIKEDEVRQFEKKRIALELHDGIMNKLASTRLNLGILSHKTDPNTIKKCLKYIDDIYQIEQDIRIVSHDLNHEAFQKEDSYIKLVEDFVKEQNNSFNTHFEVELDADIDWNNITSEVKMNVYRIIQEACYNINKHAKAKNAILTVVLDYPNICLSITDDGIGFDKTATHKGIGIQNMQTRVKLLNGKFNINSIANHSTAITIAIQIA